MQDEADRFKRLLFRHVMGGGPHFVPLDTKQLQVVVGTAYMWEYDRIRVEAGASDAPEKIAHRWDNSLSLTLPVDDRAKLILTTYWQPRFDKPSDYRLLQEAALTYQLLKHLKSSLLVS